MEAVVKLSDKAGLHGRPGALLVQLALTHPETKIVLEKNGKRSEANSILNLLALGVGKGQEVQVSVTGKDEAVLMDEVSAILKGQRV